MVIGAVSLTAPLGWLVERTSRAASAERVCLRPRGVMTPGWCAGLEIEAGRVYGAEAAGRPWPQSRYRPRTPMGWYEATDVEPCPVPAAEGGGGTVSGPPDSAPVESGFRPVGTHTAYYDRWSAACTNGHRFFPQAWYLPTSRILIKDYSGHAETGAILRSVTFPGRPPAP